MESWIIGVWFLGMFGIAGMAYMLGGYKTAPTLAMACWTVLAIWFLAGPIIWKGLASIIFFDGHS